MKKLVVSSLIVLLLGLFISIYINFLNYKENNKVIATINDEEIKQKKY